MLRAGCRALSTQRMIGTNVQQEISECVYWRERAMRAESALEFATQGKVVLGDLFEHEASGRVFHAVAVTTAMGRGGRPVARIEIEPFEGQ
jgi:hypothetical protein